MRPFEAQESERSLALRKLYRSLKSELELLHFFVNPSCFQALGFFDSFNAHSTSPVSSAELPESSLQHAPRVCIEFLIKNFWHNDEFEIRSEEDLFEWGEMLCPAQPGDGVETPKRVIDASD